MDCGELTDTFFGSEKHANFYIFFALLRIGLSSDDLGRQSCFEISFSGQCFRFSVEAWLISCRIARAASAGSWARVMGRPTTSMEAPWVIAWAGVAMRFWSLTPIIVAPLIDHFF